MGESLTLLVRETGDAKSESGSHAQKMVLGSETFQESVCRVCAAVIDWRTREEVEARKKGTPHPHESGRLHQGFLLLRQNSCGALGSLLVDFASHQLRFLL